MAFIDYEYYLAEYKGSNIPSEDFVLYAERACDIIDGITAGKASGFACKDSGYKRIAAKKAACAQTEMLFSLGGKEYLGIAEKEISREEIGNASISYTQKNGMSYLGIPVSGLAVMYLTEADLLPRRI